MEPKMLPTVRKKHWIAFLIQSQYYVDINRIRNMCPNQVRCIYSPGRCCSVFPLWKLLQRLGICQVHLFISTNHPSICQHTAGCIYNRLISRLTIVVQRFSFITEKSSLFNDSLLFFRDALSTGCTWICWIFTIVPPKLFRLLSIMSKQFPSRSYPPNSKPIMLICHLMNWIRRVGMGNSEFLIFSVLVLIF